MCRTSTFIFRVIDAFNYFGYLVVLPRKRTDVALDSWSRSYGVWMKRKGPSRELLKWYIEYKQSKSCARCGMSFRTCPEVLDFDHTHGKKRFNISEAVRKGLSKALILSELERCQPLCSNCHRQITVARRKKGTTFGVFK